MSLNVPDENDIYYDSSHRPGTAYGPYIEKAAMLQKFLSLAIAHPGLVSIHVLGQGHSRSANHQNGPTAGWDLVLFVIGNSDGGRVLWDENIHGNEDFGVYTMYAIMDWLLTSGHSRAERILAKNYVGFFPFVNYRWSRMNYNEINPCTSPYDYDVYGDQGPLGVNIARDFKNGNQQGCHDNWAPVGGYSQPETLAMLAAMDLFSRSDTGWFYVNLHQGASSRSSGGPRASECETKRRQIYSEMFGGSPSWSIGTDRTSHAAADAVEYYGASQGCLIEVASTWAHSQSDYISLTEGAYFKELLSLFVAQCELCESGVPPPPEHTLSIFAGAGGMTNPSPGNYPYLEGSTAIVNAVPNTGYYFDHWELDGITRLENPINILMNQNYAILAVFSTSPGYTLTISTTVGGTTSPAPKSYSEVANTTVQVTAYPDTGYNFNHWILDGITYTTNPINVLMDANHTLTAYFTKGQPPPPPPEDQLIGPLGIWTFPLASYLGSLFPDVKIKTSTILEDINKRWKDWLNGED